jgi:hypothetical protein
VMKQKFEMSMMGELVTPLVLLALKLEHNIMCIDISCCLSHLECIH